MPRTVNEAAHARRRKGFLDTAQRLIETKGYERMTIQDVLNELGTSKGALYHYFDSKQALLEGIVERFTDVAEAHLARGVADPDLPALAKLSQFFAAMARWKVERRELLLDTLPLWVSDENAVFRQKMRKRVTERIAPLLSQVVDQGEREGVFKTRHPDQIGRVTMGLLLDLNEAVLELFMASRTRNVDGSAVERTFSAYTDALERVLGAREGSLVLADPAILKLWFESSDKTPHSSGGVSEETPDGSVH